MDKDFELYKLAIGDEQYYRQMFHSRLSYHTNILLALLTAIGAGYLQADVAPHYFVIAIFSFLYAWITSQSTEALERIYDHFIEMLQFREELEVRLGLRSLDSLGEPEMKNTREQADNPVFWTDGHFFKKAWTQSRVSIGYFARMRQIFGAFIAIGLGSGAISFVTGLVMLSRQIGG